MDEVEIRELLIDHIGHRCCWGSRPARTWKIHAVEDCNVYVGTLETFLEEREVVRETEPYLGGNIDGKDNSSELGIWELDLRSQFPVLFVPYKETRVKIPHGETIEKCSGNATKIMEPMGLLLEDFYILNLSKHKFICHSSALNSYFFPFSSFLYLFPVILKLHALLVIHVIHGSCLPGK